MNWFVYYQHYSRRELEEELIRLGKPDRFCQKFRDNKRIACVMKMLGMQLSDLQELFIAGLAEAVYPTSGEIEEEILYQKTGWC